MATCLVGSQLSREAQAKGPYWRPGLIVGEMKVMQQPPEDGEKKTIASRVSNEIRQAILRGD